MPVEIDETQLGSLQTIAKITQGLLNNPKTRKAYLETVKAAHPNIPIPEIDAAAPINSEISGLKTAMTEFMGKIEKTFDDERTERVRRGVDRAVEDGRSLMRKRGYTEEGIKAVEDMMSAEGIGDYNNALKIYEHDHPLASPGRPGRTNIFEFIDESAKPAEKQAEYIKDLMATRGDDENVLNRQISTVLNEVRAGQ